MYKLNVGGQLVQQAQTFEGLTLLKDPKLRRECIFHQWVVHCPNGTVVPFDVPYKNESKDFTVPYFDGVVDSIFLIRCGMGGKMSIYMLIDRDPLDNPERFREQMKDLVPNLRKQLANDLDISKFILNSGDTTVIFNLAEYAPSSFLDVWLGTLLDNDYVITEVTDQSFKLSHLDLSKVVKRDITLAPSALTTSKRRRYEL